MVYAEQGRLTYGAVLAILLLYYGAKLFYGMLGHMHMPRFYHLYN